MKIVETIEIALPPQKVVAWFEKVSQKPPLYAFSSHQGVFPIEGKLTQVGSLFETREKFAGIGLRLRFRVIAVEKDKRFVFKLVSPLSWSQINGAFELVRLSNKKCQLRLVIFQKNTLGWSRGLQKIFFSWPLSSLIRRQIQEELKFIKRSLRS